MENKPPRDKSERPTVYLELVGIDGNAFSVMGAFRERARKAGWYESEIKEVLDDAMSKDYKHLLRTIVANIKSPEEEEEEDEDDDEG